MDSASYYASYQKKKTASIVVDTLSVTSQVVDLSPMGKQHGSGKSDLHSCVLRLLVDGPVKLQILNAGESV